MSRLRHKHGRNLYVGLSEDGRHFACDLTGEGRGARAGKEEQVDSGLGPAAPPQALLGSLWHATGMSGMPWEMSWFPSLAAFIAFSALLWLLPLVFVYRLAVTMPKPQVGVSAGADPSPGRQGGGQLGPGSSPRGGLEGPCLAGEAVSQPGPGQPGPGGSGQAQVWPWRLECLLVWLRRWGTFLSHPLLSVPV